MNNFYNAHKRYYKINLLIFISSLIILFLPSCENAKNTETASDFGKPILFINGEKISTPKNILRESNSVFISLDSLKNILKYDEKLIRDNSITSFISLDKFEGMSKHKDVFNDPKSIVVRIPLIEFETKKYIELKYLRDFFDVEVIDLKNHIAIFSDKDLIPNSGALINKNTEFYISKENGSENKKKSPKSMEVYFSDKTEGDKMPVYIDYIGLAHLKFKDLNNISNWNPEKFSYNDEKKSIKYKKIQMSWDIVESFKESLLKSERGKIKGLDLISPTGFWLERSGLKTTLSTAYIKNLKKHSYVIHCTFSNSGDKKSTSLLLDSKDFKKSLIDSLIFNLMYYNIDGINMDFVNINHKDYPKYVSFCSEIGSKVHQLGMSFTVNISLNDKELLDYSKLKTVVDYFVLMAMDEHSSSSLTAGPVASIKWIENNIKEVLQKVPADNIILAQAAYVWDYAITKKNNKVLSSEAYGVNKVEKKIKLSLVESEYDEFWEQPFYKFRDTENNKTHIIWYDDKDSSEKKLNLLKKYNLAGIAIWSLGFEHDWYWEFADDFLNPKPPR